MHSQQRQANLHHSLSAMEEKAIPHAKKILGREEIDKEAEKPGGKQHVQAKLNVFKVLVEVGVVHVEELLEDGDVCVEAG